jgi:hypothetical protein
MAVREAHTQSHLHLTTTRTTKILLTTKTAPHLQLRMLQKLPLLLCLVLCLTHVKLLQRVFFASPSQDSVAHYPTLAPYSSPITTLPTRATGMKAAV